MKKNNYERPYPLDVIDSLSVKMKIIGTKSFTVRFTFRNKFKEYAYISIA